MALKAFLVVFKNWEGRAILLSFCFLPSICDSLDIVFYSLLFHFHFLGFHWIRKFFFFISLLQRREEYAGYLFLYKIYKEFF